MGTSRSVQVLTLHARISSRGSTAPASLTGRSFRYGKLACMADVLGTFEQAVLMALIKPTTALGKEAYGRAVLKEVQVRLDREVSAGAVYATLDRLEQKGLISSK